jgi:ABC-type Zn uptake system ZnuABC Zn-binding protein ZnuA
MNRIEELRAYITTMEEDFMKFYEKGNNAAGTRARKALQGLKKLASDIRNEIQTKKQEGKNAG